MAIQVFGEMIEEDEDAVYYKFGAQSDMMDGIAKIKKPTLEIVIVKNLEGKLGTYLMCKLASKIVKRYRINNEFPKKTSSQS